jgi:hypothetical protein
VTPPAWLDSDPVAALVWLANPDVQPWVPSLGALTAARAASVAARRVYADVKRSQRASAAKERTDAILGGEQVRADRDRARIR